MTEVTTPVDVIVHHDVQGSPLDREGFPFDLSHTSIPGIVFETSANHPIPLSQISPLHARSYEIGNGERPIALWKDRYRNPYASVTLKGNNFTKAEVVPSATAPSGFIPYGLQEGDALYRVALASQYLRRHNIPTEWIVGFFEPTEMPFNGSEHDRLTQDDYKRKLVEVAIRGLGDEKAATVRRAIMPMKFYITARAMEIGDRPWDFSTDETANDVKKRLHRIFRVYNLTHKTDPEFHALDANRVDDMIYYFSSLLPQLRGTHLARLHQIGIAHRFPVYGNTTALGGVIDLDSAHGEPLGIGDPPIDDSDIFNDIVHALDPGYELSVLLHLQTLFPDEINVAELYERSVQEFIDSYLNVYDECTDSMSSRALLAYGALIAANFGSAHNVPYVPKKLSDRLLNIAGAHLGQDTIERYSAMVDEKMSSSALDYINSLLSDKKYQILDTAMCGALRELQDKISPNEDVTSTAKKFYTKFIELVIGDLRLDIAYHLFGEVASIGTIVRSSMTDIFNGFDEAEDKLLHMALTSSLISARMATVIHSTLNSPKLFAEIESLASLYKLDSNPMLITQQETAEYRDAVIFKGRMVSIHRQQDLGKLMKELGARPDVKIRHAAIDSLQQFGIITPHDIVQIISDASTVSAEAILTDDDYSLKIEVDDARMGSYVAVVTSKADVGDKPEYIVYIYHHNEHQKTSS